MIEDWEQLGLTVLSVDADKTLVLFSTSDEMAAFRERLGAYEGEVPPGQKNPPYNAFISSIESIGALESRDRVGPRFKGEGFAEATDFQSDATFLVDIELWDVGERKAREHKASQISAYIQARGGEVLDLYIGPSISMLRVRALGAVIQTLLTVEDIASIDQPPQPDMQAAEALELTLNDVPELSAVGDDTPVIGIIDSGVNAHPFFKDILVGAIGVPTSLGTADDFGHGTRVGGLAVFGDLQAQLDAGTLARGAKLCSAKVVNDRGAFDDRRLVPSQMREAISTLHKEFQCRIFVLSLGHAKQIFDGDKVGPWAATLDELARELNVVIVVSAGNRHPRAGNRLEQAVTEYPNYLLEVQNRFCEPAGAVNVLTVGALAHGEGIDASLAGDVRVRPITKTNEPAPFTRVGPGIGGSTKPELVDIGGTLVYDPVVLKLRGGENLPSAGVLTTHHEYVDRLFTAGSGTSYAAPRVAFSAAQILTRMPGASANLVRALLVGSAEVPQEARDRMQVLGSAATRAVCGNGLINLERAAFSDDSRVVLYVEDSLAVDHFAVYQIPIPDVFQTEAGEKCIQVTLAYDPPVRHTRNDYVGIGMSFRLLRGCQPNFIFEHYRKRAKEEGPYPELPGRYNCKLLPGPQAREAGTVQTATVSFKRGLDGYGDTYYLVVRCEGGWADFVASQSFSVVVEISHKAGIRLYERIRQQIRLPS